MSTILDLLEKVEQFDAYDTVLDGIIENENIAVSMNKDQLMSGVDSESRFISPEYQNDNYASLKNSMNPKPGIGIPDLKLTGDFQGGFYLDINSLDRGYFEIDSIDDKTENLLEKYPDEIFGLTDENEQEFFLKNVMDYFAQEVLNKLNLVMHEV